MTTVCKIWMISLELNWFVYDSSWILHLSEFVWTLRSSVLVVFNNFILIDATDRSKISSDQKRFFISLSFHPLSFFANTPIKHVKLFTIAEDEWNNNLKTIKNDLKTCCNETFWIVFQFFFLDKGIIKFYWFFSKNDLQS